MMTPLLPAPPMLSPSQRTLRFHAVPPSQKSVSIFEQHIDILCERNSVVYGHKVCLSFGRTGLVLEAEVLRGNPADSMLTATALKQVQSNTGRTPHDVAMDRSFPSKQNLVDVRELGIVRVDFTEGRGIDTVKACGNRRIRRNMRCFRAGAEGLASSSSYATRFSPLRPPNRAAKSRLLEWGLAGLDSKQRYLGTGGLTGSATQPAEVWQLS